MEYHEQYGCYVLLQRKDDEATSFCRECTDSFICAACAPNSPITKFKRLRSLIFIPLFPGDPNTEYEVVCSCPFHAAVGAPCHHFCLFIRVLPRHIHIRYHKSLDVLYKREGHDDKTKGFRKRLGRNKLIITNDEYKSILTQAHTNASPMSAFRAESSVPVQKNRSGVFVHEGLSKMRAAKSASSCFEDDAYNQGGMVQMLKAPMEDIHDWPEPVSPSSPLELPASDLQSRVMSMMQQLVDRHKSDPLATAILAEAVETFFCNHMAGMDTMESRNFVTPLSNKKVSGTKRGAIGMKSRNFDMAHVCVRTKSSCEPKRPATKKSRKTKIGTGSLLK